MTYAGDFKSGKPEGAGTMSWNDKRSYKGEFFNGKPVGIGCKTSADQTEKT